jgi:predicted PurR-regulated permease PerM
MAATVLGTAAGLFTGLLEVLLLLYLLLAAGDLFYEKLLKVMPMGRDKRMAANVVNEVQNVVFRYIAATFLINVGQGAVVAVVLWLLGMPNPVLWGLATVVLEFIPYLGAAIMIAMLSVVAFASLESIGRILLVPLSYFIIGTIQNNIVSPYAYGARLKMNAVAVLVSVLFFWFLWGIAGAFLAVPIFATIMIICAQTERFRPVAEFLAA